MVQAFYEALSASDVETVQRLLAPDIEWWFHGPPSFQYLMRLLAGDSSAEFFEFVPQTISPFGSIVLVEGCEPNRKIPWVHAWTVSNGVITQVKEYINTSLMVTQLNNSPQINSSSSACHCLPSLWESTLSQKSMPGFVLAIWVHQSSIYLGHCVWIKNKVFNLLYQWVEVRASSWRCKDLGCLNLIIAVIVRFYILKCVRFV